VYSSLTMRSDRKPGCTVQTSFGKIATQDENALNISVCTFSFTYFGWTNWNHWKNHS